ncbi:conserved hypothetical protein [Burkholderia sp. H160]|nr:conserved hypothetical protein [Burkholderia sp. H160]
MLSQQEISDRLEIQQLSIDYAHAIDSRNYDGLDSVFTDDAYIDYRVFGGIDGRYPEIKAWLKGALAPFPTFQHLVSNMDLRIERDQATGRIMCLNPVAIPLVSNGVQIGFYGLWYIDTYVRTAAGWRIQTRSEEQAFKHNFPAS